MIKNDDFSFTEPNLDFINFFTDKYMFEFTFACKFNYNTIYDSYARLFSWGEVGNNTHNIYISLTTSGTSYGGSIIFNDQKVQVDVSPGTPAPAPNTD